MRKNYPETQRLWVDTGNVCDNPGPAGDLKSRSLVEGMNRLGYRVVNVGERDLMLGYDTYRERMAAAKFTLVSANVVRKDTGEPVFRPYEVVEVPGRAKGTKIRVGLLGVARHNPLFLKAGPDGSNLVTIPAAEAASRYLPELRSKADVVVLLASMHEKEVRTMLRAVGGIDLVLGAYGGIVSTTDRPEGTTPVVFAGNQGKYVGESRLYVKAGGQPKIESHLYLLGADYPSDDGVAKWVNEVLEQAAKLEPSAAAPVDAGAAH